MPLHLIAVVAATCACATPAHAYIGPGAGFAVLGSFLMIVAAAVLGGVVLVTWPLRFLLRRRRQRRAYAGSRADRVIILGFDGMDPKLTEEMMAQGMLPNFARLRETGSFSRLQTTCPAMSPVAWSSFMTGTGPGRHGIFDFLTRDAKTYLPDLSSAQIRPSARSLRVGPWRFPLGRPVLRLLRRSRPFWRVLGEHGIFSTVLRVPITFPVEPFYGLLLSGMCAPDLRGTQGSFTFFTSAAASATGTVGGERHRLTLQNGVARGALPGPTANRVGPAAPAVAPFTLTPSGNGGARLDIGGERVPLKLNEFSEWVPVPFRLAPGAQARGICRFLLRQTSPHLELYVSPINIDPEQPALPVSHPTAYSVYLSKRLGRFATLGLAEDTWALNEGVLSEAAFLEQCWLIAAERERMLMGALRNTRRGCLVCVFDTTDRVQHMFWRDRELGEEAPAPRYPEAIAESYQHADAVLGKVLAQLGPKDALLALSDHGFTSFRRGVNLNAWLLANGYLHLKPGATGEAEWLQDVDWSRTRAYAIGLGGMYLNLKGREAHGCVARDEAEALKAELIALLTDLRDEEEGAVAIDHLHDAAATCPGPYTAAGPDLLVGYAPGYRASWEAAQGRVAGPVVVDNTRRWCGDHCVDPSHVPGVLFSTLRLEGEGAHMVDLAPTVLSLFGVAAPEYMEGKSLLRAEPTQETGRA